ncbi:MAG TPA: hypothetical protein VGA77_14800 [Propylenella sp.]
MRKVLAAALLLAFVSPAFAFQCPTLWKQVDEKLPSAQLSDADRAKVTELRRQGEELHKAGDHAASIAALNEALALLQ